MSIPSPTTHRTSVALCTYNAGAFLAEQLQSIAAQTVPVDQIIACDDGSADDTVGVLRAFAEHHSVPVKIVVNDTRLGVTKNFEQAVSLCTGDIILLCDQDDRWRADKVAVLREQLLERRVDLAFSNARIVLQDLRPAGYRLWESIWFDESEQRRVRAADAVAVLARHAVAAGSTLAFRAEYLPLVLPFPEIPNCHDVWITLLLACIGHLEPVDQDLIDYRLHGGNAVGMRQYNLLGQVRMARQQISGNAFGHLADLFGAARDRLQGQTRWPVHSRALELLQEKIDHSRLRRDLPGGWFSRLGLITREIRRGNYHRYSYGYKSVLQDLFLR